MPVIHKRVDDLLARRHVLIAVRANSEQIKREEGVGRGQWKSEVSFASSGGRGKQRRERSNVADSLFISIFPSCVSNWTLGKFLISTTEDISDGFVLSSSSSVLRRAS